MYQIDIENYTFSCIVLRTLTAQTFPTAKVTSIFLGNQKSVLTLAVGGKLQNVSRSKVVKIVVGLVMILIVVVFAIFAQPLPAPVNAAAPTSRAIQSATPSLTHTPTATATIDWWATVGRSQPNCDLWENPEVPKDFPWEGFVHVGQGIDGQAEFKEEEDTVYLVLTLEEVPPPPLWTRPLDEFDKEVLFVDLAKLKDHFKGMKLVRGPIRVWMATDPDDEMVLVIRMADGKVWSGVISLTVYAMPCPGQDAIPSPTPETAVPSF
jgi:hypothetical protein